MNATSNQATTSRAAPRRLGNPWMQLIIGDHLHGDASPTCSTGGRCSSIRSMPSITGEGRHSSRVHHLRCSLKPGSCRSRDGWSTGSGRAGSRSSAAVFSRHRLVDQFRREFALGAVFRRGDRRHRRRCVTELASATPQVVPGPARTCRGLTAAGFGAGAALTIVPIANMIKTSGLRATFLTFGLFQGGIVVVVLDS